MECRKSGLPDTRWCKENGIAPSSLYYWINKLRMEATEILYIARTIFTVSAIKKLTLAIN